MILYLDASALVKLYGLEQGTDDVRAWLGEAEMVATAKVAYVEVLAALWRKRRSGELSDEQFHGEIRKFAELWEMLRIIDLSDGVLQKVRDHALAHGLRALDAIHLASALFLQGHLQEQLRFGCADTRLGKAAESEHFTVLVPTSQV